MLKTVIVEDDRMVASINAEFAEKTPGVQVVATFHNGRDALAYLEQSSVDLLLLDLYMPEFSGIDLLAELRRRGSASDAIFITAANDAPHIQEALRLGAVDYLIKPFRYERFEEALDKVIVRRKAIERGLEFTQADIDEMIRAHRPNAESRTAELEKGIQRQTLDHVRADLRRNAGSFRTAEQIAADTGLSKVTVRRYLNYLIGTGEAESQVDYSTGGRPRVEYRMLGKGIASRMG